MFVWFFDAGLINKFNSIIIIIIIYVLGTL